MRIVFWNIQRLGESTPEVRSKAFEYLWRNRLFNPPADYIFLCELLQGATFPTPQNLTYRKENPYQLCYGCLDVNFADVVLNTYTPASTVAYQNVGFKDGNNFANLVDRALGFTLIKYGAQFLHTFVFHAPACKDSATKALFFLVCDLHEKLKGDIPWMVIGDLNVEPGDLVKLGLPFHLSDYIVAPAHPTKIGKTRDKVYDYVLCNFKANVRVQTIVCSPRHLGSDHYPILVEL